MNILLHVLIIIICFTLIIWGGNKFVDCSVALAKKFRIPTAVIGATLTSIGTTLPELLVTIFSGASGAAGLAMGNALGSVIFNSCIIGGILLITFTLKIKKNEKPTVSLLLFSIFLISVMCLNKLLSLWECIILLFVFLVYNFINFRNSKNKFEILDVSPETVKSTKYYALIFLISASAIAVGAYFSVESAVSIAKLAGLSDTLIGLTIISVGTSLPELVTTISAIRKKEANLGLGNIIGSNIINCVLLTSIVGIINGNTGLGISLQTLTVAIPFALASTLIITLPALIKNKTYKWQGLLLILSYAIYFLILITSTLNNIS